MFEHGIYIYSWGPHCVLYTLLGDTWESAMYVTTLPKMMWWSDVHGMLRWMPPGRHRTNCQKHDGLTTRVCELHVSQFLAPIRKLKLACPQQAFQAQTQELPMESNHKLSESAVCEVRFLAWDTALCLRLARFNTNTLSKMIPTKASHFWGLRWSSHVGARTGTKTMWKVGF